MEEKKNLYLIDFDGTLTHKDSLFDFLKFISSPIQFYFTFFLFLPNFIFAKLGLYKNAEIKEKFIAAFLKGKSKEFLEKKAQIYAQSIEKIIRPKAQIFIEEISKNPKNDIYIVSASLDIWLKPIANKFQFNLICTKALVENDIYSGKFSSLNCNFNEKKRRIVNEIPLEKYETIFAYGDSNGDLKMFSLANKKFYKPFR